MSKIYRPFLFPFAAAILVLQLFNNSSGQDMEVHLSVDPERAIVHVEGRYLREKVLRSRPLIFLSDYAGIKLRADRIKDVKQSGDSWTYDVDVAPMKEPAAAAHVSWLRRDSGIMMLNDLLPQPSPTGARQTAKLTIITPQARSFSVLPSPITTSEKRLKDETYDETYLVGETAKAVFFLSFDVIYGLDGPANRPSIGVATAGSLQFDSGVELDLADEVYRAYRDVFGAERQPLVIGLTRSAALQSHGNWEADTRGRSITIITSDTTFKSHALQQLHEQLRHEMFHLWIPEGVNLKGNYDWFYEGFALYQSLKLGVAVNRIRFDDYLDTLSRAYDTERRLGGNLSLLDASKNRWNGDNNTVVYARGMLVAFLCDLASLEASKGNRSTDDIVREVYRRHSGQASEKDGNEAVISILKEQRELAPIVDDYVSGVKQLDWTDLIRDAGLQVDAKGGARALAVVPKPSGSQKRLLDKLGYNNWRKLSSK